MSSKRQKSIAGGEFGDGRESVRLVITTSERQSLSIKLHAGNLSNTLPSRHFINRMCFSLVALPLNIASISKLRERSWKGGK